MPRHREKKKKKKKKKKEKGSSPHGVKKTGGEPRVPKKKSFNLKKKTGLCWWRMAAWREESVREGIAETDSKRA